MLDYFLRRFQQELPASNIIRYEDIVSSGGRALEVIVPAASELNEPLESRNTNALYDREVMLRCGERLLESEGAYWDFYSRRSVGRLDGGVGPDRRFSQTIRQEHHKNEI